jgi:hypothetical protein
VSSTSASTSSRDESDDEITEFSKQQRTVEGVNWEEVKKVV